MAITPGSGPASTAQEVRVHGRHGSGHADLAAPEPHEAARVLRHLASFAPADGSNAIGPHGVFADAFGLLVTNGGPTAPMRERPARGGARDPTLVREERVSALWNAAALVRIAPRPGRRRPVALRARQQPGRDCRQPADRQPRSTSSPITAPTSSPTPAATRSCASPGRRVSVLSLFPNIPTPNPFGGLYVPMNAVPTGVSGGPDGTYATNSPASRSRSAARRSSASIRRPGRRPLHQRVHERDGPCLRP